MRRARCHSAARSCSPPAARQPDDAVFQGYVEGEFVEVAPEVGGRIVELAVERGDEVEAGDAALPHRRRGGRRRRRRRRRRSWRAPRRSSPISQQGQRPPEIAVIEAQIAEAQASLDTAQQGFRAAAGSCSSEASSRRRGSTRRARRSRWRRRASPPPSGSATSPRCRRARRRSTPASAPSRRRAPRSRRRRRGLRNTSSTAPVAGRHRGRPLRGGRGRARPARRCSRCCRRTGAR